MIEGFVLITLIGFFEKVGIPWYLSGPTLYVVLSFMNSKPSDSARELSLPERPSSQMAPSLKAAK